MACCESTRPGGGGGGFRKVHAHDSLGARNLMDEHFWRRRALAPQLDLHQTKLLVRWTGMRKSRFDLDTMIKSNGALQELTMLILTLLKPQKQVTLPPKNLF